MIKVSLSSPEWVGKDFKRLLAEELLYTDSR